MDKEYILNKITRELRPYAFLEEDEYEEASVNDPYLIEAVFIGDIRKRKYLQDLLNNTK